MSKPTTKVSFRPPPGAQAAPALTGDLNVSRPGDVSIELDLSLIDFDEDQHRQDIDDAGIKEMAVSIKSTKGVLQAIVVLPANAEGRYKLVIGERRVRGSLLLGLPTIPALVRQLSALEADVAQVVENEQRKNVNPLHTARKLRRMLQNHTLPDGSEMEHAELATMIGKGATYVSQHLRLLDLPHSVAALAEHTVLKDVDTLTNIAKLFELDEPAAAELVGKAEAGQKVTRADSADALRAAKAKRKPKDELERDPKTEDFINGRPDGLPAASPAAPSRGKAGQARAGLAIEVKLAANAAPVRHKTWKDCARGGRAFIDLGSLVDEHPGSFVNVSIVFEKSGLTLHYIPLEYLEIVEIIKL